MLKHLGLNHSDFEREYRTPLTSAGPDVAVSAIGLISNHAETVATYLNKRLKEIGVGHVFAIPGDYISEWVETLDDPTQNAGLVRVHPNNEMTATYAADGYGRATNETVGCVAFTYGIGAINAAQAIAGAKVEKVPLVFINGSPSVAQSNSERDQGVLYHHMLDGSHTDQRIFHELSAIAVRIDNPAIAPDLIDAALRTCLTASQPVYIELVNQVANQPCRSLPDAPLTASPLPGSPTSLKEASNAVLTHIRQSKRLVIMAGVEIARSGLQQKLAHLLKLTKAPYVTSALGKGILSEFRDDIRFSGVYMGQSSQKNIQQLMEDSDCIVALGVQDTDFNYLGVVTPDYSAKTATRLPGPTHIQVRNGAVLVGRGLAYWGDVGLEPFIDALIGALEEAPINAPFPGLQGSPWEISQVCDRDLQVPITWDSFKSLFYHDFWMQSSEPKSLQLVADSGFSFVSLINVKVPESGYIAQLAWAAIGYGVGATTGITLANETTGRKRRTVTVTGDGAFAETLNALGTMAQLGQDNIIFVMDNRVFAVEQWLINSSAFCPEDSAPKFTAIADVPQGHIWDYEKLAEAFGGQGYAVSTNAELKSVLNQLHTVPINPITHKSTFTLVSVRIPAKDLPENTRWKLSCPST